MIDKKNSLRWQVSQVVKDVLAWNFNQRGQNVSKQNAMKAAERDIDMSHITAVSVHDPQRIHPLVCLHSICSEV